MHTDCYVTESPGEAVEERGGSGKEESEAREPGRHGGQFGVAPRGRLKEPRQDAQEFREAEAADRSRGGAQELVAEERLVGAFAGEGPIYSPHRGHPG